MLMLRSLCVSGEEQVAERGRRDVRLCLLFAAVLCPGGEAPRRGQQAGDGWAGAWGSGPLAGQAPTAQGQDGSARCVLCLVPDSSHSNLHPTTQLFLLSPVSLALSTMSELGSKLKIC